MRKPPIICLTKLSETSSYIEQDSLHFLMCFLVGLYLKQVRVSGVLSNAPYLLNLDYDHYINNSKAIREAMCFMMDPLQGKRVCYVQFSQRFDGVDNSDKYAIQSTAFFDVRTYTYTSLTSSLRSHSSNQTCEYRPFQFPFLFSSFNFNNQT